MQLVLGEPLASRFSAHRSSASTHRAAASIARPAGSTKRSAGSARCIVISCAFRSFNAAALALTFDVFVVFLNEFPRCANRPASIMNTTYVHQRAIIYYVFRVCLHACTRAFIHIMYIHCICCICICIYVYPPLCLSLSLFLSFSMCMCIHICIYIYIYIYVALGHIGLYRLPIETKTVMTPKKMSKCIQIYPRDPR